MAKKKPVSYELIKPDSVAGHPMYAMLQELIAGWHDDLYKTNARIALAWNLAWQQDVDRRVTLGKCKKATDLDRELYAYDFVILLNMSFWQDADVKESQRRALLDHELMHAQVKLDEDGEYAIDVRNRFIYRIRKHDIEEFSEIVGRHGCYKRDLEVFYIALRTTGKQGTLPLGPPPAVGPVTEALRKLAPKPGGAIESVTISSGGQSVTLTQDDRRRMDAAKEGRR